MNDDNITWGFYGWYKPIRDEYSQLAKQRMKKRIKDHPDLGTDQGNF